MRAAFPRAGLDTMMAAALAKYGDDVRAEWARIRIESECWRYDREIGEVGEFWVVAMKDGEFLWFDDVEGDFAWSAFSTEGVIDGGYLVRDFELILGLIEERNSERVWTRLRDGGVPAPISGTGREIAQERVILRSRVRKRFEAEKSPEG